jgi:pyruvate formate lyase activating enzyme
MLPEKSNATCHICGTTSAFVAKVLGVCGPCIREYPEKAMLLTMKAHRRSRERFGLPVTPPMDSGGVSCKLCVNNCRIVRGARGYCGLRRIKGETGVYVDAAHGKLTWYMDPLPTNCVGDWVCAGGTGAGFPLHAHCPGPEYGHNNLAVFFHACSFNCLYCQNWSYRQHTLTSEKNSVGALVADVDHRTACICYFGGDPTPQLPFSIRASKRALIKAKGRILRLCWETNGSMNDRLLDKMMELAIKSGGCVKFDLKAWDDNIHKALTGVTNRQTLANFKRAAQAARQRPVPPALIASTLMVPGYVDVEEVANLAKFIASVDPDIPYALLAFQPHFYLSDLPLVSETYADRCLQAANAAGLKNVRIGNRALLQK